MIDYEREYSRLLNMIYSGKPQEYPEKLPEELQDAYDRYWGCRQRIERTTFEMYRGTEKAVYEYLLKK